MKLRTTSNISAKHKLSTTMRSWLHILQTDLEGLKDTLEEAKKENPFIEIKSGNEVKSNQKSKSSNQYQKNSVSNTIEALSLSKKSLYDRLYEQIQPPLFPTKTSVNIALEIIKNINNNGYLGTDISKIAKELNTSVDAVESVRKRFAYLEPSGVGAIDLYESFLFQLNDFDLESKLYSLCTKIIKDFENLGDYQNEDGFLNAIKIIRKLKNPPALEFQEEVVQIIPDIFIENQNGEIKVSLNNSYYPEIVIDTNGLEDEFLFVKKKLKEAKNLLEALELRKETLTKIALMLVEYQYDFFQGGDIKPLKLDDLSVELDRHHSTISRAISNKYLSCNRGIFSLKSFFSTAIDEDTSNRAIKSYIKEIIKNEDKKKPLSDNKILTLVNKKFGTNIGRRTITKYRISESIESSNQRKKQYQLKV